MSRKGSSTRLGAGQATTLCDRLGYSFDDVSLLEHALTHRSWCAENTGRTSNERLEFLGDAVLGMTVAEFAYLKYPDLAEGELAKIRASVVNGNALVEIARSVGLGEFLFLGKGERSSGGNDKPSILADAMEAVLGAVFLDSDFDRTRELIIELVEAMVAAASAVPGAEDHKTLLQEHAAQHNVGPPVYAISEAGPDHAKVFSATVSLGGDVVGAGAGGSKKEAEQAAAREAWQVVAIPQPSTTA